MSKNESRKERRRQENNPETETRTESRGGISKVYYYIIGFLFLVLLGLVIFIFSRGGNDVNLEGDNEDQSALVNEESQETSDPATENETEEPAPEEEETTEGPESDNEEETTEEQPEETEEESTDELQPGDSSVVNEDAPHDPDHATDYNDGSADRVAIKNEIIAATGLNDDLIEWWVGNDGPGRVEATVSSRDQSEIYQVYLQYGDGNWHVLNYERINSIPNN